MPTPWCDLCSVRTRRERRHRMARVRLEDRERVRAFWRGHSAAWKLIRLTQREYCLLHGLSLKNFGNWRGQLKREAEVGHRARWGRHPRLRQGANPGVNPMAKKRERLRPPPPPVDDGRRRREFSDDTKRRLVEETFEPGRSVTEVARRYGIDLRLLRRWRRRFGIANAAPEATAT